MISFLIQLVVQLQETFVGALSGIWYFREWAFDKYPSLTTLLLLDRLCITLLVANRHCEGRGKRRMLGYLTFLDVRALIIRRRLMRLTIVLSGVRFEFIADALEHYCGIVFEEIYYQLVFILLSHVKLFQFLINTF